MKNILKYGWSLLMLMLLVSCNERPELYTLETPPDQMYITASTDSLVLEKVSELEDAISFTWNEAADRGEGINLEYYFRLYQTEMTDNQSELIQIDEDSLGITLTGRELNNVLSSWGITPGQVVTVEAEVLAIPENSPQYLKPEYSVVQFDVVGYDSASKLYITIEKDGQQRSVDMDDMGNDVYYYEGEIEASTFWFVRNNETGMPGYFKGDTETSLVYSNDGDGDVFSATDLGEYHITVDLINLTIDIDMDPINRLYLITSISGMETVIPLEEIEAGTDVFYYKEYFDAGTEFRFVRTEDSPWPAYVPGVDSETLELKDEGAQMFSISQDGTYVITANMNDLSLIQLDIYDLPTGVIAVVGDAVSAAGWNAGAAIESCQLVATDLENRPEVLSYTGNFQYDTSSSDNSFKFVGDANWGYGLFAEIANANPFDANEQGVTDDSSGDKKWTLPSSFENGTYTLELNLHTMEIDFIQQ